MGRKTKSPVLLITAFLCFVGSSSSATAAQFTASATGSFSGKAVNTQVFTINAGTLKCNVAAGSGTITSVASQNFHSTIRFSACTFMGFTIAEVSPATLEFTANRQVHLQGPVTISIPAAGCSVTIPAQTFSTTDWTNVANKLKAIKRWIGIRYNSSGGLCGSAGTNGTFTGEEEYERSGGGTLAYDP